MKALVKSSATEGIWLEDVPEPQPTANDVLIRVRKTAICGTDLHIYKWDGWARNTIPISLIAGYEFVGEIVEVGSNANDYKPGMIVSAKSHIVRGRCRNCMAGRRHLCPHTNGVGVNRNGAFAEYIVIPNANVWHHAEDIDLEIASIFDPFGNAAHSALAERYDALIHVDDSHATGVLGRTGRGTPEYRGCMDRVDVLTSTLGKALGGGTGGFASRRKGIIDLLRQRSRPYLFSNSLAPAVVCAALKALELAIEGGELRKALAQNISMFREGMLRAGFELMGSGHPIVPVMLYDAGRAGAFAEAVLTRGVNVVAFSYPVVPKGKARIRAQISAAHTLRELDCAIAAFGDARREVF